MCIHPGFVCSGCLAGGSEDDSRIFHQIMTYIKFLEHVVVPGVSRYLSWNSTAAYHHLLADFCRTVLLLWVVQAMGGSFLVEQPRSSMLLWHPRMREFTLSLPKVGWFPFPHGYWIGECRGLNIFQIFNFNNGMCWLNAHINGSYPDPEKKTLI